MLEQLDAQGGAVFYHHDALGSTRLLTDAAGSAVASFSYSPYGTQTGATGTQTTPFGFAGEYTDQETGFQYLRARYYDPQTAQFLTRDPLGLASGETNLYGYAGRNPVNAVDPSGLSTYVPRGPLIETYPWIPSGPSGIYDPISDTPPLGESIDVDPPLPLGESIDVDPPTRSIIIDCIPEDPTPGPLHDNPEAGNPYRGPDAPNAWWQEQGRPRGISREDVRERLHKIKHGAGLGADDDVIIGRTGDVYDAGDWDHIGSLTRVIS